MIVYEGNCVGQLGDVSEMRRRFSRAASEMRISEDICDDIALMISEVANNAIMHADPPARHIALQVSARGKGIELLMEDDGGSFDDYERTIKETDQYLFKPMIESGRGLGLLKTSSDKMEYAAGPPNRWALFRDFERRKSTILIIEDDVAAQALYDVYLADEFYIHKAYSLKQASALLKQYDFDLIIADFHIGDGNTIALLHQFDREGEGLQAPVLIVTADTSRQPKGRAETVGAYGVYTKPIRPQILRERVRATLAAHRTHEIRLARRIVGNFSHHAVEGDFVESFGVQLAARGDTAMVAGGDLFHNLGGVTRQRFVLADCVGHGPRARLSAIKLSGIIHAIGMICADSPPDVFLDKLSQCLFGAPGLEQLLATVQVLDILPGGTIELATGGHPSPVILNVNQIEPFMLTGALPGLSRQTGAVRRRLRLPPNSRLLMATDGMGALSTDVLSGLPINIAKAFIHSMHMPLNVAADYVHRVASKTLGHHPNDDWTFCLVECPSSPQPS